MDWFKETSSDPIKHGEHTESPCLLQVSGNMGANGKSTTNPPDPTFRKEGLPEDPPSAPTVPQTFGWFLHIHKTVKNIENTLSLRQKE